MPCYSPEPTQEEFERIHRNKIEKLEAMVCSCIEFSKVKGCYNEMLSYAKKNSEIDLADFAMRHAKKDEERVSAMLRSRFSQDDLAIVKKLLGNK